MRTDFSSDVLDMSTSMVVLLPQPSDLAGAEPSGTAASDALPPVLYLLHGLGGDCTVWERRTAIERYAAAKGIAVVMPEVRRSFYCDEVHGEAYWTFVSRELPELVARTFRVSQDPADTFVAGLSMGGYGALKLALRQPERFAAAASLSGVVDVAHLDLTQFEGDLHDRIWGGAEIAGTDDDLPHLLRAAAPGSIPELYLACGTEDFLYGQNREVVALAEELGHGPTVSFGPGDHEWGLWDAEIARVLDWLPIRSAAR